jgi:hypothetical protein
MASAHASQFPSVSFDQRHQLSLRHLPTVPWTNELAVTEMLPNGDVALALARHDVAN